MGDELAAHFEPGEHVELALGLALFHGFSKMLICLGLEPAEMDTTVLPTPEPSGADEGSFDPADPWVRLLATRPDLAAKWHDMRTALDELTGVDQALANRCRERLGQLIGVEDLDFGDTDTSGLDDELVRDAVELAELFVIDIRAIGPDLRDRIRERVGSSGLVQLVMNLAVFDGICRYAACLPGSPAAIDG